MRVLVIKTSSLGDLVHFLPALTDAKAALPDLTVDWVAEEGFAAIPAWHPAVHRVIPVALRRWRKRLVDKMTWREVMAARAAVRAQAYDAVIDAQGLVKSAMLSRWAHGVRWGYDRHSIREPLASLAYDRRVCVSRELHAITRNRRLLAAALGYDVEDAVVSYGLDGLIDRLPPLALALPARYVLALHGTSRIDKEWPEAHWVAVGLGLADDGRALLLPWGNAREKERAERIVAAVPNAQVLPRLGLDALACIIARADAVLGVDTGLMHVAAALRKPGLALFPATLPRLTGVMPESGAPSMHSLTAEDGLDAASVLARLREVLA